MSSVYPFTSTAQEFDPVFVVAAKEMENKYFGPVPTNEFLSHYLPEAEGMPAMPQWDARSFKLVSAYRIENHMYEPMIKALQPFCQSLKLINTSLHEDPKSGVFLNRRIKPDISYYDNSNMPAPDECPTNARTMLGFLEFKNDIDDEPFATDISAAFERDTVRARDTRGQITVYNTTVFASQFRTRIFSAFVNKSSCRLMCATRSGTVVTESFDYTEDPSLATFFWRLSHSSAETRGIDTTIVQILGEEVKAREYLQLSANEPLFRISVVDEASKAKSSYIVSKPFTSSHNSPTGRCTRCFRAFDIQRRKVVLLKDNWRVDGYEAEGLTYRVLNSKGIKNVPILVTAGNVSDVSSNTCGDEPFLVRYEHRVHHHYRLVLDTIGHSLTHFDSTWQLVRVIADALAAHRQAFFEASRLHRDISVGNIIITDEGRGMLIDWELSKDSKQKVPRSYERTGTWQFKSIRLLRSTVENPVQHVAGDDIESFLWVLAWVVARNVPHGMSEHACGYFLQAFDQLSPDGSAKTDLLLTGAARIRGMALTTVPLQHLLTKLWLRFGGKYGSDKMQETREKSDEEARRWLEDLRTHDWMIETLETALSDELWQQISDPRVARDIKVRDKILTGTQKKRKSAMTDYGVPPLPKKVRIEPRAPQTELKTSSPAQES
ncbi:hypothetical protein D9757_003381 [Collybiopsis confluens]|uniref:Fungal-type protein kinase domain-containing protein n=1 Tax=Collybiopsis confluens TaxID=2823264 RepID=A0A8H5HTJ6_9AGAR|nr:hypothetical protein D9757_003381 [Collybiopsis confluens]